MAEVEKNPTGPLGDGPPPVWIPAPAGHIIPVRRFGAGGTLRPVVLVHGLQSHSGWFVQAARRVASIGHNVYAFDRCGSGLSTAEGDPGRELAGLVEEIDAVATHALSESVRTSVYLLAYCFGALPALLYAALYRPERVAGVVLATPAFFTRPQLPLRSQGRVVWSVLSRRPRRIGLPFLPHHFSELDPFIKSIRDDPLALWEVPARLLFEARRARARLPQAARALQTPLLVAMAGDDPICDNRRNRRLLHSVRAPVELHEYAGARHILEFSRQREAFLGDLAAWLKRHEELR